MNPVAYQKAAGASKSGGRPEFKGAHSRGNSMAVAAPAVRGAAPVREVTRVSQHSDPPGQRTSPPGRISDHGTFATLERQAGQGGPAHAADPQRRRPGFAANRNL